MGELYRIWVICKESSYWKKGLCQETDWENISMTRDIAPGIFSCFCITTAFWKTITPASLVKGWLNSKQILEFKVGDLQEDLWTYFPEITACLPQQRSPLLPNLGGRGTCASCPTEGSRVPISPLARPPAHVQNPSGSHCVTLWEYKAQGSDPSCHVSKESCLWTRVLKILLMYVCAYIYICVYRYTCMYMCI